MNFNNFCFALSITACLMLLAPSVVIAQEQSTRQSVSEERTVNLANVKTLLNQGQYMEVLQILRPFIGNYDIEADVLFIYGMAAAGASQLPELGVDEKMELLDESIAAFHTMLIHRPELARVRLELARAFYLKGEDKLAREHFEHVLAGDLPMPVVVNVQRFLSDIRARRRWRMHVGFALLPDSNIGFASDERIIYINGIPFTRQQEELTSSGVGLSLWMSGEYHHRWSERIRLRTGASGSLREFEGSRFDEIFLTVHSGPKWFVGQNSEASVLASVQQRLSAPKSNADYKAPGLRFETEHRLSNQTAMKVRAEWHDRRYSTQRNLNGEAADLSLSVDRVMTPAVKTHLAIGFGYDRTEEEKWRNNRRWLRTGIEVALPKGFSVGGKVELRWTDYEGNWFPHTPADVSREDRTYSYRVSAHNRAIAWKGFSPQFALVHEVRTTNAQLYDYSRTGFDLSFVRLF